MPLPDPHAGELTAEVSPDLVARLDAAKAAAKAWTEEANRLAARLRVEMGDAFAATVNGEKVYTYRPQDKYAVARLRQDYPDLTKHFMRHEMTETLDVSAFAARHPQIADQYRVRALNRVGDPI